MLRFVIMKIPFFLVYKRNAGNYLRCNATFDVTSRSFVHTRLYVCLYQPVSHNEIWSNPHILIQNNNVKSSQAFQPKNKSHTLPGTHYYNHNNIRDFCGHLPYLFQNPISNFYLSLEAGKSSTDSGILRKLTNVEIVFRAWTKPLKRTKLYFDD